MKTVLISGSSIAGPTLAYWLARHGFAPTIVERSLEPRRGGHAIDVRGAGTKVIRAMGVFDAVYDLRTRMGGFSMLDNDGKEVARTENASLTGGRLDNDDIEILRDELSLILIGALGKDVETIYGDSIVGLKDAGNGMDVTFEKGTPRRFDLVVAADGLHSNVRDLTFGDEAPFIHPLGLGLAVYSAPNHMGFKDWQYSYSDGENTYIVYPARKNTELRVCFTFPATKVSEVRIDLAAQKALVAERFRHFRWEIPKLLDAMPNAADFYLGLMAQIRMPSWTKGRVALIGDSGYSPSPFTGQGTSLALVGGYLLAHELAQSRNDHNAAFARYETKMRPFVEKNQAMASLVLEGDYSTDETHQTRVLQALDEAKNAIVLEGVAA